MAPEMTTMLNEVVAVGTGTRRPPRRLHRGRQDRDRPGPSMACGYKAGAYVSSFAGFVPAEQPALTGMVVLDDTADFGAAASAPRSPHPPRRPAGAQHSASAEAACPRPACRCRPTSRPPAPARSPAPRCPVWPTPPPRSRRLTATTTPPTTVAPAATTTTTMPTAAEESHHDRGAVTDDDPAGAIEVQSGLARLARCGPDGLVAEANLSGLVCCYRR